MRMTFRVASAGNGCIFRYPDLVDEDEVKTNGVFDYDKCAKAFADLQSRGYCLVSSKDGRNAMLAGMAFLYNLKECADKMIAKGSERRKEGDKNAPHAFADSPADRRATRKLDAGKGAYVRVDVKDTWPVRIRVGLYDPDGGDMQRSWTEDVALLCIEVADAMSEKSRGKVVAEEGVGCEGMIAKERKLTSERRDKS